MKAILIACLSVLLPFSASEAADLDAPGQKKVTVRSEIERGGSAVRQLRPRAPDEAISIDVLYRAFTSLLAANKQQNTDSEGFLLGAHLAFWAEMVDLCDIKTEAEWNKIPPDERLQRRLRGLARGWLSFDDFYLPLQTKLGGDDVTLCKLASLNHDFYGAKIEARKRHHKEYEAQKLNAKKWTIDGKVISKDGADLRIRGSVTSGIESLGTTTVCIMNHPEFKTLAVGSTVKCLATEFSIAEYPNGEKVPCYLFAP